MNDLDHALFEAWHRVAPKLLDDPAELRRRLDRRKLKTFTQPLRACCVAVRASDNRINDNSALIIPRTAISLDALAHPGRYAEHQVTLDKPLLEHLCAPVKIDAPGEPADHVARQLGCRPDALMVLRRNGTLRADPKPGLMGRRGRPVQRVFRSVFLDPQSHGRTGADDIFACSWIHNASMLPEDFSQTLTRTPQYLPLHRGQERFIGWRWLCPQCGRSARILHYPVNQPDFPTLIGFAPAKAEPLPKPAATFACRKCHGIHNFGRMGLGCLWNTLILRCSGGLLYGHEVKKPDWLKPQRKHAYAPRRLHAPQRERIQRLIVETDLSYRDIAAQVGISPNAVAVHASTIFKRHHVHTRADLQSLLRPAAPAAARAG